MQISNGLGFMLILLLTAHVSKPYHLPDLNFRGRGVHSNTKRYACHSRWIDPTNPVRAHRDRQAYLFRKFHHRSNSPGPRLFCLSYVITGTVHTVVEQVVKKANGEARRPKVKGLIDFYPWNFHVVAFGIINTQDFFSSCAK